MAETEWRGLSYKFPSAVIRKRCGDGGTPKYESDRVRISHFEKGYMANWTEESIVDAHRSDPPVYRLVDWHGDTWHLLRTRTAEGHRVGGQDVSCRGGAAPT